MKRRTRTRGSFGPLLLGLYGLGGAGIAGAVLGGEGGERAASPRPPAVEAPVRVAAEPVAPARAPVEVLAAAVPALAPEPALAEGAADAHRPARTEREFLDRWRALERTAPGVLEARAETTLAGPREDADKVAFLRALRESGSPEADRWLAHAVRTLPDEPSAHARSVASFALDALCREAACGRAVSDLLAGLAFDCPAPSPALRRRAAAAYARHAPDAELSSLRRALLAETDELLVAGVLASLAEREPSPALTALQLELPAVRSSLEE